MVHQQLTLRYLWWSVQPDCCVHSSLRKLERLARHSSRFSFELDRWRFVIFQLYYLPICTWARERFLLLQYTFTKLQMKGGNGNDWLAYVLVGHAFACNMTMWCVSFESGDVTLTVRSMLCDKFCCVNTVTVYSPNVVSAFNCLGKNWFCVWKYPMPNSKCFINKMLHARHRNGLPLRLYSDWQHIWTPATKSCTRNLWLYWMSAHPPIWNDWTAIPNPVRKYKPRKKESYSSFLICGFFFHELFGCWEYKTDIACGRCVISNKMLFLKKYDAKSMCDHFGRNYRNSPTFYPH